MVRWQQKAVKQSNDGRLRPRGDRGQHGLTVAEVEDWREKFLVGAENALRSRPKDDDAIKDEQVKSLKQKIGDLVLDNDILREALKPDLLDRKTSDA